MEKYELILIDDTSRQASRPSLFKSTPISVAEAPDKCALVIRCHASLSAPAFRPQLLAFLRDLRAQHPEAKILALNEYGRNHIHVRDDMNALRKALSDIPLSAQPASV